MMLIKIFNIEIFGCLMLFRYSKKLILLFPLALTSVFYDRGNDLLFINMHRASYFPEQQCLKCEEKWRLPSTCPPSSSTPNGAQKTGGVLRRPGTHVMCENCLFDHIRESRKGIFDAGCRKCNRMIGYKNMVEYVMSVALLDSNCHDACTKRHQLAARMLRAMLEETEVEVFLFLLNTADGDALLELKAYCENNKYIQDPTSIASYNLIGDENAISNPLCSGKQHTEDVAMMEALSDNSNDSTDAVMNGLMKDTLNDIMQVEDAKTDPTATQAAKESPLKKLIAALDRMSRILKNPTEMAKIEAIHARKAMKKIKQIEGISKRIVKSRAVSYISTKKENYRDSNLLASFRELFVKSINFPYKASFEDDVREYIAHTNRVRISSKADMCKTADCFFYAKIFSMLNAHGISSDSDRSVAPEDNMGEAVVSERDVLAYFLPFKLDRIRNRNSVLDRYLDEFMALPGANGGILESLIRFGYEVKGVNLNQAIENYLQPKSGFTNLGFLDLIFRVAKYCYNGKYKDKSIDAFTRVIGKIMNSSQYRPGNFALAELLKIQSILRACKGKDAAGLGCRNKAKSSALKDDENDALRDDNCDVDALRDDNCDVDALRDDNCDVDALRDDESEKMDLMREEEMDLLLEDRSSNEDVAGMVRRIQDKGIETVDKAKLIGEIVSRLVAFKNSRVFPPEEDSFVVFKLIDQDVSSHFELLQKTMEICDGHADMVVFWLPKLVEAEIINPENMEYFVARLLPARSGLDANTRIDEPPLIADIRNSTRLLSIKTYIGYLYATVLHLFSRFEELKSKPLEDSGVDLKTIELIKMYFNAMKAFESWEGRPIFSLIGEFPNLLVLYGFTGYCNTCIRLYLPSLFHFSIPLPVLSFDAYSLMSRALCDHHMHTRLPCYRKKLELTIHILFVFFYKNPSQSIAPFKDDIIDAMLKNIVRLNLTRKPCDSTNDKILIVIYGMFLGFEPDYKPSLVRSFAEHIYGIIRRKDSPRCRANPAPSGTTDSAQYSDYIGLLVDSLCHEYYNTSKNQIALDLESAGSYIKRLLESSRNNQAIKKSLNTLLQKYLGGCDRSSTLNIGDCAPNSRSNGTNNAAVAASNECWDANEPTEGTEETLLNLKCLKNAQQVLVNLLTNLGRMNFDFEVHRSIFDTKIYPLMLDVASMAMDFLFNGKEVKDRESMEVYLIGALLSDN